MSKAIMLNGLGGGITDTAVLEYSFEQTQYIFNYRWVHNLGWTPSAVVINLITEPTIPTNTEYTFTSAIIYIETNGTRRSSYEYLRSDGVFAQAAAFIFEANDEYALLHPGSSVRSYVQAGDIFKVVYIK